MSHFEKGRNTYTYFCFTCWCFIKYVMAKRSDYFGKPLRCKAVARQYGEMIKSRNMNIVVKAATKYTKYTYHARTSLTYTN